MNPQTNEPTDLYNILTVKNIDNEDFIFSVNKEQYLIKAGETRNFPKFMVNIGLKHLIDKILLKKDPEGKLVRRTDLRDELASQIIIDEVSYAKPQTPTDAEVVEQVNRPSDLERILEKNKKDLKVAEPIDTLIPPPNIDLSTIPETPGQILETLPQTHPEAFEQPQETFEGLEEEKLQPMPTRAKMLAYAKNVLKLTIDDPKQKLDKMKVPELFEALGLDKEEDLGELGLL